MAKGRGRASVAHRAVAPVPTERPEPPPELDAAEAAEWRAIVASLPPSYFRKSWPVLADLCFHVCASRRVQRQLRALPEQTIAGQFGRRFKS